MYLFNISIFNNELTPSITITLIECLEFSFFDIFYAFYKFLYVQNCSLSIPLSY